VWNTDSVTNGYGDCYCYSNCYTNSDSHSYGYTNGYIYPDIDAYRYLDPETQPDATVSANSKGSSYSAASAVTRG
jgi:hypothetical protein